MQTRTFSHKYLLNSRAKEAAALRIIAGCLIGEHPSSLTTCLCVHSCTRTHTHTHIIVMQIAPPLFLLWRPILKELHRSIESLHLCLLPLSHLSTDNWLSGAYSCLWVYFNHLVHLLPSVSGPSRPSYSSVSAQPHLNIINLYAQGKEMPSPYAKHVFFPNSDRRENRAQTT